MPSPTPGTPGEPTPPPGCLPGACLPRCSFPDLRLNGEAVPTSTPGLEVPEGPLTVSFRTPKPGNCPHGWNSFFLSIYPEAGGPPVIAAVAREALDVSGPMPLGCYEPCPPEGRCPADGRACHPGEKSCPRQDRIYLSWSDGAEECLGWDEPAANTFTYTLVGAYQVDATLLRVQCGQGFAAPCRWRFVLGDRPTQTASLSARVEYYSDHDADPYHGPDNPYTTVGPSMYWNYGEVLHVHPIAGWEEPAFPGWTARTTLLRWKYLGSATGGGFHPARCDVSSAAFCDWQPHSPRHYVDLRWFKVLRGVEREGVATAGRPLWVYATEPVTVTFAYQVQAETVWTPQVPSWEPVVLPFTQTLSVTVGLKHLVTYRGNR